METVDHFGRLKVARHEAEQLGVSETVNKILADASTAAQKAINDARAVKLATAAAADQQDQDAPYPAALQARQRRPQQGKWDHLNGRF